MDINHPSKTGLVLVHLASWLELVVLVDATCEQVVVSGPRLFATCVLTHVEIMCRHICGTKQFWISISSSVFQLIFMKFKD